MGTRRRLARQESDQTWMTVTPQRASEGLSKQFHPLSLGKEICYEDLGCFSDAEPWAGTAIRPLKILPWSPEKISTRFLLYTNESPDSVQVSPLSF